MSFSTRYLGNGLELAVCVVDQIHHSADSSRGVKIVCQGFDHAGFGFGQPGSGGGLFELPRLAQIKVQSAGTVVGAAVPLPEKGFLHGRALELTLHVSLSVVHEAGDGSQGTPGLRHAAVAVVNSWEINANA